MRLLALATSGPLGAVGAADTADTSGPVEAVRLGDGAERGRGVAPAVEEVLRRRGWKPTDVEGVAVDVGPGSFTGSRVGVATAKGICLGLGVPAVAVSSLDALALAAGPTSVPLLCLRDARAGEAYFALYAAPVEGSEEASRPRRLTRLGRGTAADIRRALEERGVPKVLAVGEDAERLAVTLPLSGLLAGVRTPVAGPEAVLAVAIPRFHAGTTDDAASLAPAYLQPSTPEARLAARGGAPPPPT
jgi:tRNA threonylcarbamoyladenosine biosynthesis protein TsaB